MVVRGQQAGWMVMVWLPAGTEGDGLKKVLMCGSCSGLLAASRVTHARGDKSRALSLVGLQQERSQVAFLVVHRPSPLMCRPY